MESISHVQDNDTGVAESHTTSPSVLRKHMCMCRKSAADQVSEACIVVSQEIRGISRLLRGAMPRQLPHIDVIVRDVPLLADHTSDICEAPTAA